MGKKKLQRFEENLTFKNLFQPAFKELTNGFHRKGCWKEYFQNSNPIVVELACGKGEYTIGLAHQFPGRNFIGIDIKGARIWKGCKLSNDMGLNNVAFIRARIELIENLFDENEIQELYIIFPDPQPKKAQEKKRLTSPSFLERYSKVLSPEHLIHLKTDNASLYRYTLEIIDKYRHQLLYETDDVYNSDCPGYIQAIKTFYEEKFLKEGKRIHYLVFKLSS